LLQVGGLARWHELTLHALGGDYGSEPLWLCLVSDIQRLKEREEKLERFAGMQTDMLDISVDCIKLISLEGAIVHMNRAGCRALGVVEGSSFGMPWLPLLPSDVHAAGEQALAMARGGRFARFPGRSQLPGANPQYWDNMLTPVIDEGTGPRAILCVSREVTTEREAQEA
jgi:PAS domain-containing protein